MLKKSGASMTRTTTLFVIFSVLTLFGCAGIKDAANDLNRLGTTNTDTVGTADNGLNAGASSASDAGSISDSNTDAKTAAPDTPPPTKKPIDIIPPDVGIGDDLVVIGTDDPHRPLLPGDCKFAKNNSANINWDGASHWVVVDTNSWWFGQVADLQYTVKRFSGLFEQHCVNLHGNNGCGLLVPVDVVTHSANKDPAPPLPSPDVRKPQSVKFLYEYQKYDSPVTVWGEFVTSTYCGTNEESATETGW
jgi:hypothetical protein